MAEKEKQHPYASPGAIAAAINHFRKSFPGTISADTLRKLGIAPNNESYVINTLRFIGVIDAEGTKTAESNTTFSQHDDAAFQKAFGAMVQAAYGELFKLFGDAAWELDSEKLIGFFRNSDQTSDIVGRRQATTFQALSGLAGHSLPEAAKPVAKAKTGSSPKVAKAKPKGKAPEGTQALSAQNGGSKQNEVGLTVRIEVNLPAAGDQETYDRIFRSIRENLLNAK